MHQRLKSNDGNLTSTQFNDKQLNDEEIKNFGKIYNLKNTLQDKYMKAKAYKTKYSQAEKDKFCRNDHLMTSKSKEFSC